jgi:hypothetical protein
MVVQPSRVADQSDLPPTRRRRHRRSGLSRRLLRNARYRKASRLAMAAFLASIVVTVTLYLAWRFSLYEPPPAYFG